MLAQSSVKIRDWGIVAVASAAALSTSGCDNLSRPSSNTVEATSTVLSPQYPVLIREPLQTPTISAGVLDEKGRPVEVTCDVCHTSKSPNPDARIGVSLTQFHQGLVGKHGNLTCIACHHVSDGYASLRLADGRKLEYADVMTLCAQCHGPQFRDYQHGAHGGMTGHWDLSKGGRIRNNCVDCHNPHDPSYPIVTPSLGPNDRTPAGGRHE